MRKRRYVKGQSVVIGALLFFALLIGISIYAQVVILPEINKNDELDAQEDSLQSMYDLRVSIQLAKSTNTPQTVIFDNSVEYIPQPASPKDQYGQIRFIKGNMKLSDAETVPPDNNTTAKEFESINYNNVVTGYTYIPSYIELTDDRKIVMDNMRIYENTTNNTIKHKNQSIINGKNINLVAIKKSNQGIKKQGPIPISIHPNKKIKDKITGEDSSDIELKLRTTRDWNLSDQENVVSVNNNDGFVVIKLDGDVEYNITFLEARLRV